jgi:mannose-6-phosphate isomerase-like protein (cupin superfamily)
MFLPLMARRDPDGSDGNQGSDPVGKHRFHQIENAKLHYHERTDEFYYVVEGQGALIVDDDQVELHKGVVVFVPRGVKHKAIGKLTVLTICVPRGVLHDIHELE